MKKITIQSVFYIIISMGLQYRIFSQLPIQFKLIDVSTTVNKQVFLDVTTGAMNSKYSTPVSGYMFCLFKVEAINPNTSEIDITGSKLKIEGPEGEIDCYAIFSMEGHPNSFAPCSALSLTIKRKKSREDQYLAVIKEDVYSLDFIYENSDTLKILIPN